MTKRKFPIHPPVPLPHNQPLWQDWSTLIKEFFIGNPDKQVAYVPDAQEMVADLRTRFINGKYDQDEIDKKLMTCYKFVPDKGYEFLRSDFIKEVDE